MTDTQQAALSLRLCRACGADTLVLREMSLLAGGSIQQNWLLRVEIVGGPWHGAHRWVLRTGAASSMGESHTRADEFALLRIAYEAGVRVPEPLFLFDGDLVPDASFFVMRHVHGIGAPREIVRSDRLGGGREALAAALGRELARIHAIRPPRASLSFLKTPPGRAIASHRIDRLRARLDALGTARPVQEWGLRHLEREAPDTQEIVLCHGDFRTGNILVDEYGVAAVLDWEFAGWGDRLEDIGWFCARCWRHGGPGEAGGIGSREAFYGGYEAVAGCTLDRGAVPYWELMATTRWAVIAAEQADRHVSGREPSLELALTAHILPELEHDIMQAAYA